MPDRPDISIITPCYNAEDTIDDTLASICGQTHTNWEAICIDDESTDATPKRLAEHARRDARIRVLRGPHGGPGPARNLGVAAARADRLLFVDADDQLRPDAVAVLLEMAGQCDDRTLVVAGYELLDEVGRPLSLYRFPRVDHFSVDGLLRGNPLTPMTLVPAAMLDAEAFDARQEVQPCADWDLWLRLASTGAKCVAVPRVLFRYRLRALSMSHHADATHAAARYVVERWLPRATDPGSLHDARHRTAYNGGAVALAAGDPRAIDRFLADLPELDPSDEFLAHVVGCLQYAFVFVRGAIGQAWHDRADDWLAEIRDWVQATPIAPHAGRMLAQPVGFAVDSRRPLAAATDFIDRHAAATVVVYGLGTNGLIVLEHLRGDRGIDAARLRAADDRLTDDQLAVAGVARVDPRRWDGWPPDTVVLVTPNDHELICRHLARAGGREGRHFLVVPTARSVAGPRAAWHGLPA